MNYFNEYNQKVLLRREIIIYSIHILSIKSIRHIRGQFFHPQWLSYFFLTIISILYMNELMNKTENFRRGGT